MMLGTRSAPGLISDSQCCVMSGEGQPQHRGGQAAPPQVDSAEHRLARLQETLKAKPLASVSLSVPHPP